MWLKKIWAIDLNKKYFQGNAVQRDFLWRSSSQKTSTLKSFILNCGVNLTPDEIFEPSIEISNDLTMDSDAYLKLLDRISSFRDAMSFHWDMNASMVLRFSPVLCNHIWYSYKITFRGNETIINNKEVLKEQFSSKSSLIYNLMMFSINP